MTASLSFPAVARDPNPHIWRICVYYEETQETRCGVHLFTELQSCEKAKEWFEKRSEWHEKNVFECNTLTEISKLPIFGR